MVAVHKRCKKIFAVASVVLTVALVSCANDDSASEVQSSSATSPTGSKKIEDYGLASGTVWTDRIKIISAKSVASDQDDMSEAELSVKRLILGKGESTLTLKVCFNAPCDFRLPVVARSKIDEAIKSGGAIWVRVGADANNSHGLLAVLKPGDLNSDGIVDADESTQVLELLRSDEKIASVQRWVLDINNDGAVNEADLISITTALKLSAKD